MDTKLGMIDPVRGDTGREIMRTPDEVTSILELQRKGWGAKRIARALGISKNTVKRYLRAGGWQAVWTAVSGEGAGSMCRMGGRAIPEAPRQRRRGASGASARVRAAGVTAHHRASGRTAAASDACQRRGHRALRDAAWAPDAGGLRPDTGPHRRREGLGLPVRDHPGLLTAHLREAVSSRAAGQLVAGHGISGTPL